MTVEWTYDNPAGGDVEIDPADFEGMEAAEIRDEILGRCREQARREAVAYAPKLNEVVASIIAMRDGVKAEREALEVVLDS